MLNRSSGCNLWLYETDKPGSHNQNWLAFGLWLVLKFLTKYWEWGRTDTGCRFYVKSHVYGFVLMTSNTYILQTVCNVVFTVSCPWGLTWLSFEIIKKNLVSMPYSYRKEYTHCLSSKMLTFKETRVALHSVVPPRWQESTYEMFLEWWKFILPEVLWHICGL